MSTQPTSARIAIACGGTGGHLFPGIAVADELLRRGCSVLLLVSKKEVDRLGTMQAEGVETLALPAVGLTRGKRLDFLSGFWKSFRSAKTAFAARPPAAALAMGGFTSGPALLAAKQIGAKTFLHESNTIPGRANRLLSWAVDHCFVGFPSAAEKLHTKQITVTGTPVRPQLKPASVGSCRVALGLDPERPTILITGGSQGATGLNELVIGALPQLAKAAADCQWIHLTGPADAARVEQVYEQLQLKSVVQAFCDRMDLALGAATVAIGRAGASSLAELAAMQLPALLIPYPAATDNHQYFNARAFEQTGAARLLQQKETNFEQVSRVILELLQVGVRRQMQAALAQWHRPQAAAEIAEAMLSALRIYAVSGARPQNQAEARGSETKDSKQTSRRTGSEPALAQPSPGFARQASTKLCPRKPALPRPLRN